MLAIEKDVPRPEVKDKKTAGKEAVYPFKTMVAGDSFVIPIPEGKTVEDAVLKGKRAKAAFQKKHGGKFSVYVDALGQARCWCDEAVVLF